MKPIKKQFLLDPKVTFLNHGSFGATPRPVFREYQRWQRELEYQPVEFLGRRHNDLLRASRQALADYLGTERDDLVYVINATTGINIVARSLKLGPGDEVLTSDHEYGACDRAWRFMAGKGGFRYRHQSIPVPVTTPGDLVETLWQGVTSRTKVIFLSHITSPTALIFPVAEVCRRAKKQGILTVIDGAHAPGQIALDLDSLGADFYTGNLHKWLSAPKGSAFLYARPEVQATLEPLVISWGYEAEMPGPSQFVDHHEFWGTRDISAFLAVPAAIRFQRENHWSEVRAECHKLAREAQQRIVELTGLPPLHPDDPVWYAQMAAAPLPAETDIVKLKMQLYDEYRIEVPLIAWNEVKLIRVSIQGYNGQRDVEKLMRALVALL